MKYNDEEQFMLGDEEVNGKNCGNGIPLNCKYPWIWTIS